MVHKTEEERRILFTRRKEVAFLLIYLPISRYMVHPTSLSIAIFVFPLYVFSICQRFCKSFPMFRLDYYVDKRCVSPCSILYLFRFSFSAVLDRLLPSQMCKTSFLVLFLTINLNKYAFDSTLVHFTVSPNKHLIFSRVPSKIVAFDCYP